MLKDCLFGAVTLAKNPDPDKYSCPGYDVQFALRSRFFNSRCCVG